MTGSIDALYDDVAYIRRMAEAGRKGPPLGGLLLAAFGGYIGVSALLFGARAFELVPLETPLPDFTVGFIVFALVGLTTAEPTRGRILTAFLASLAAAFAMMIPNGIWYGTVNSVAAGAAPGELLSLARYAPAVFALGPLFMLALGAWLIFRLRRHAASEQGANRVAGAAWISALGGLGIILVLFTIAGLRTNNWFLMMSVPGVFWTVWGMAWLATGFGGGPRWSFAVAAGAWVLALAYAATFELFVTSAIGLFALALAPGLLMIRKAGRAGTKA